MLVCDANGYPLEDIAMTEHELALIERQAQKYGSANSWTGTAGTLAKHLLQLVREVRGLRARLERYEPRDVELGGEG